MQPAVKYQWLTEAQNEVVADIAARFPNVLYVSTTALPTLSTSDNKTFTFGTDNNGYAIAPMGKVGIYPSLDAVPDCPWREGIDFIKAGATAIRIPNNNTYTGGTLYWNGITPPANITGQSASVGQPSLFPEPSRELIVFRAVHNFALRNALQPALADLMAKKYGYPLAPNPGQVGAFAAWASVWRTQYKQGGALNSLSGMQLAILQPFSQSLGIPV